MKLSQTVKFKLLLNDNFIVITIRYISITVGNITSKHHFETLQIIKSNLVGNRSKMNLRQSQVNFSLNKKLLINRSLWTSLVQLHAVEFKLLFY